MWLIYALTAAIIWGLDYTLSEQLLQAKISPVTLLGLEMLLSSLVFLSISYKTQQLKAAIAILHHQNSLITVLTVAFFTFGLGNVLAALSIQAKNATLTGLIELTYPLFTLVFTWLLFKQSYFSWSILIGAMFIIIGVSIIGRYG